jgi:putative transposase
MSRPLRIEYPGAWYHVMNRGRRAEAVFSDDEDYKMFIQILKEASASWNIRISAYCLMPNHYHLLVQTPDANISRSMRHINGVYTQRYNRRHDCDGQLFRGRFKSILVSADSYLLQLVRYIHRNPVKATIAAGLNEYPWSSHPGYLSKSQHWNWVYKEFIFLLLTQNKKEWVKKYREFVAIENDEELSRVIEGKKWPAILGGKDFMDWVKGQYYAVKDDDEIPQAKALFPEPEQIIDIICDFYAVAPDGLYKVKRGEFNEPRNVSIYLMRKLRRDTLKDIGARFRMEKYSSVSSVIERLKKQMEKDKKLKLRVDQLQRMINKSQGQT